MQLFLVYRLLKRYWIFAFVRILNLDYYSLLYHTANKRLGKVIGDRQKWWSLTARRQSIGWWQIRGHMPQIAGACDFRTRRVLLFDCRLHSGVRPIPARPTSNALKQLYDGLSGSACITIQLTIIVLRRPNSLLTLTTIFLRTYWTILQRWIRTGTARNAVPAKFFTTGTAFRLRFCRFATSNRA